VTGAGSRLHGRGRLLCALAALRRRADRFAAHRASTPVEQAFARRLLDALDGAYAEALSAPGSRQALASVDARRAVSRKAATIEGRGGYSDV
jgi:hypothetical protein